MSKLKGYRLDVEVEKCRVEGNFKRLQTLLPQICAKNSGLENLSNFLSGETLLEQFLEAFEDLPQPDSSNRDALKKARKHLSAVVDGVNQLTSAAFSTKLPQIQFEAQLLLGKLYYVCAQFDDSISAVNRAKIDQEPSSAWTSYSLRTLRLVAEAFAVRGLSLEAIVHHRKRSASFSSRLQKHSDHRDLVASFERSIEISLLYVRRVSTVGFTTFNQLASSSSGSSATAAATSTSPPPLSSAPLATTPSFDGDLLGPFIKAAFQRAPAALIDRHEVAKAVHCLRNILLNVDRSFTQQAQRSACRQLAAALMRHSSSNAYEPPSVNKKTSGSTSTLAAATSSGDVINGHRCSPALPEVGDIGAARADRNAMTPFLDYANQQDGYFCPKNVMEEAYLLLNISEAIACKEAVLSRAEDHRNARQRSLRAVASAQNLLAILLSRLGQYGLLCETYEKAARFAYGDIFVWFQFALALLCNGRFARSMPVIRQCLFSPPGVEKSLTTAAERKDLVKYLLASQTCIEQLGLYDDGIAFAKTALGIAQKFRDSLTMNRAHLMIGSGLSLKAQCSAVHNERQRLNGEALRAYRLASDADPRDHVADFFSALQSAQIGRLDDAARLCRVALAKRAEQPAAVMLLALILTADGQYAEALRLVEQALDDYPSHYGLLVFRLKLEMKLQKASGALLTAKDLLLFWRLPSSTSPDRITVRMAAEGLTSTAHDGCSVTGGAGGNVAVAESVASNAAAGTADAGGSVLGVGAGVDLIDSESLLGSVKPLTEYGGAVSTISDSLGLATSHVSRDTLTQYRMQSNIWLELAELFLSSDDYLEEVRECVEEACLTFPNSHQVLYLKGRLLQKAG